MTHVIYVNMLPSVCVCVCERLEGLKYMHIKDNTIALNVVIIKSQNHRSGKQTTKERCIMQQEKFLSAWLKVLLQLP